MTIKVKQMLVPTSKHSVKCPYQMDGETITIHNTYNDASAESEVKYMIGNSNQVSFHFAIDDLEVVQGVSLNRNAWHSGDSAKGDGNRKSISIEICYSKSGGVRYQKAEALTVKFVAQLLKERGWGVDRVRTHRSWNEIGIKKGWSSYIKNCPHRILSDGRWQDFLNAVSAELKVLNQAVKPPAPPTAPMWDGMIIKESQIGRITVLKPINLWRRESNGKLTEIRVLQVGDVFRVYNKDEMHGGQYDLGANCWVTNMEGFIKYETPSKSKKAEADKYYNR